MLTPRATALLTALALIAFAGNSVLNRLALASESIGPVTFTLIRLLAGAVILLIFAGRKRACAASGWASGAALFVYALGFSLAYVSLDAGAGALILFGVVQVTMIGAALVQGERFSALKWTGFAVAVAGLLVLLLPGASAPGLVGVALMAAAGLAWGVYSLRGRGVSDATGATAGNFARAFVLCVPVCLAILLLRPETLPSLSGAGLAILSGAVTSGLGYVIWYAALKGLQAGTAGMVQLSVPVIAAVGGAVLIGETIGMQLVVSAVLTLGGIALVLLAGRHVPGGR